MFMKLELKQRVQKPNIPQVLDAEYGFLGCSNSTWWEEL
jgi:hypothetical protein